MTQRILVVDDDPSSVDGLRALLAAWGYSVETASNGRAALENLAIARPTAVITDIAMPVMNGLELLRALRTEWPAIPVIVLTGYSCLDALVISARRHGAYACLTKPVDVAKLKALLACALEEIRREAMAP